MSSSATPKALKTHKTTKVDDHRIISMVRKNYFTTSNQTKNTPEEVGVSLSDFY